MEDDTIIQFPDLSGTVTEYARTLSVDFDRELANLHDALTPVGVTGETVRDYEMKVTYWVHMLETAILEARTALAMWMSITDELAQHPLSDFESKVRLDRGRNYFAKDTAIRLSLVVELMCQLTNEVHTTSFGEADPKLRKKLFDRYGKEPSVKALKNLTDTQECKRVQMDLRNAFVHRGDPTRGRAKWVQDGDTMFLTSGKAAVRVSEALRICIRLYEILSQEGVMVLRAIEESLPERLGG